MHQVDVNQTHSFMKTLFRIAFALLLLVSFHQTAQSQDYKSAIGARFGFPLSASYKTFLSESSAVEAFVGFQSYALSYTWINIGAAYQIHNDISGVDGLKWYYGAGASVYLYSFKNVFVGDNFGSTAIGLQGYLGLDYRLKDAPINISLDWVPTFFLSGFNNGFSPKYGALSVRYILGE